MTVFAKQPEILDIHGPTIIAFFPPVTQAEIESDGDLNEALSDFQYYVSTVKKPLNQAGITFFEVDSHRFKIRVRRKLLTGLPGKSGVGYYLIVPGRSPHVEHGVMTDADLLDVARRYFRCPIVSPASE